MKRKRIQLVNMIVNRTDELVLNIQSEGQMSIFDLMSDVSTDSTGKQITIQDVKDKMKEHLLNYNTGEHLSKLTAEFYVKYGLIGYISMVNDALKELEKDGYIQIGIYLYSYSVVYFGF